MYRKQSRLDSDSPTLQAGVLPFYAIDRSTGYISEPYLWPFLGYVDRTEPYVYHARHYLWPLWVQGRGDQRRINRWAPFYAHSTIKGHDKTWAMWPLWRQASWKDQALLHERRQLLYLIYHETKQSSLTNPDAPSASKVHLWPFFTAWNNGAGRKQFQTLSPLEVFLPFQERTRQLWSPLFSVYRFNQTSPGETRHSVLWDAFTWARSEESDRREIHLGPLVGFISDPEQERIGFLPAYSV
ncbi:MAG: hypothetical protein J6386_06680 [Candidatus Synoicihabitans palmerolidicus]|nr:hypothetical protein [Candidatus Synoicihabitans palmerolidicus]